MSVSLSKCNEVRRKSLTNFWRNVLQLFLFVVHSTMFTKLLIAFCVKLRSKCMLLRSCDLRHCYKSVMAEKVCVYVSDIYFDHLSIVDTCPYKGMMTRS